MKQNHLFYFLIFLFTFSNHSVSQVFNLVNSPASKLNYAVVNDQYGFAMVGGTNQFKSIDQGQTWTQLNSAPGSPLYFFEAQNVAISSASTMCLVGFNSSTATYTIVRTTDGGTSWTQVLSTPNSEPLKDLAANGNTLIVTGVNGIYRSTDAGLNWTFISLSSGGESSPFVRYNPASSSWLIGGYQSYFQYSSDNGVSWQNLGLNFSPDANIVAESVTANGLLIARKTAAATQMLLLNAANTIDTNAIIESGLVMNGTACLTGAFFNGNLLTHNQSLFYRVDPINNNVYHFGFPTSGGSYLAEEISLGTNYGIAITSTSGGNGRIYRIDLTQNPNLYVPSYFTIQGPGPCAGDPIIATANADYADSLKWYVNNIAVSTANTLNYSTSAGVYMTYNVKLVTYYNGVSNTTTKPVVMTAPTAPHGYTHSLDTLACYGLPLNVLIDPNPSTPVNHTVLKMLYNGQLIYGPVVMTNSNINASTASITTSGTLQIITYKTNYCDPNADTTSVSITVGPNLFDFSILPHDSIICVGVNPDLYIDGTNSLYNYDFHTSYSFVPWTSNHLILPGNSTGTLMSTQSGSDVSLNDYTTPETYGDLFMYVNLKISDTMGCTPSKIIDTIRIVRSTAYFELHSRSQLSGDTLKLSNAYVSPNRLWSSTELNPLYIQNETDTIPFVIPDTTGFFGIKLRNEPIPGCVDSMINYVHYTDPATIMGQSCESKEVHEKDRLHHAKIDQFGNIYEVRAHEANAHAPLYILRKNDPFGNLIWDKRASYTGWGYGDISGIAIEALDFDSEGNPIIGMWLDGISDYQDEYVDYQYNSNLWVHGAIYVMKIDKTDGSLIWSVDLVEAAPAANLELYQRVRLTDLVVDGNWIHVSTYSSYQLNFITLNTADGSLVNTAPFEFNAWSNTPFITPGFLFGGASALANPEQSYWSPQIDVLSTGEVVAVGNYQNVNMASHPELLMPNSDLGMFIMKYHPDHGVYDVANIAQTGTNQFYAYTYLGNSDMPKMFVDKNDNITVAGLWEHRYFQGIFDTHQIKVLDSIIPMETGTFVVNMDSDYTMNWLTMGTHSEIEDMAYIPATNETYFATKTRDNFSMGSGNTHIMAGEVHDQNFSYTHLPAHEYPWLNYGQNQGFVTKLDSDGLPVEMKLFSYPNPNNDNDQGVFLRLAATACGDLAIYTTSTVTSDIVVDNQTISPDSVMLFLQYSNCVSDDCSYLDAYDTLKLCETNGSIDIQLADYYNLNTLSYDVIVDGTTVLMNQSATVTDGHFSVPLPTGATQGFTVAFTSPNADTLEVVYSGLVADFGILADDHFCIDDTPIQLDNSTPSGGEYSGAGVLVSQFNPSIAGIGSHFITYTYTDQYGCYTSDSISVLVDSCSYLNADDSLLFCNKDSIVFVQINDYYDLNTVSFDIIVNGVTVVVNQTETVVNGQFSFTLPSGVTNELKLVFTSPNADTLVIHYSDLIVNFGVLSQNSFCVYNGPMTLGNSTPSGGFYSGNGIVGNLFYPSVAGLGTHLISYIYTDDDGCSKSDTASIFVDDCAGIEDQHLNEFQVYPNPFTSELHLVCSEKILFNSQLNLLDHVGRIILQLDITHKDTIILLGQLSKGNYTLEISQAGRCVHREKIVKM